MQDKARDVRIFFALWPDQAVRSAIIKRREQLGRLSRRQVPDHNLHLTLLFLGNQRRAMLSELLAAVDDIQADGFVMLLDQFGWFPAARVAWLGGTAPDSASRLVELLNEASRQSGIHFRQGQWKPHITLFRQVHKQPDCGQPQPLSWPVSEFVLLESVSGQPYRILHRWQLGTRLREVKANGVV